jgi:hypothetical protein
VPISFLECFDGGFVKSITGALAASDIDKGDIAIVDMAPRGLIRDSNALSEFFDLEKALRHAATFPAMARSMRSAVTRLIVVSACQFTQDAPARFDELAPSCDALSCGR